MRDSCRAAPATADAATVAYDARRKGPCPLLGVEEEGGLPLIASARRQQQLQRGKDRLFFSFGWDELEHVRYRARV